MKIKEQSKDGVIYQVEMQFEEIGVAVIDIEYSGYEDALGNDVLEFCWANVGESSNPDLTEAQLDEIDDILECGYEERVVVFLQDIYAELGIRFDVGDYKNNPTSILYCKK